MKCIRIAQVVGKMFNGGVEAVVMNYYRHIDRNKVQFDFIVDEDSTFIPHEEIEKLGGRVYIVPPYQKLNKYIPALIRLFKENEYKIVHSHINTLSVFPLYAAKKAGISIRIAQNHSTVASGEWKKNILKYTLRPFAKLYATHYAACSKYTGEWLFGKKSMECGEVKIFNNAIELEKFKYDENLRNEVRKELGLEGKFVIGHVGRFCYVKNHEFLIDVFEKIYTVNQNAVLMLVGDGPEREKIENRAKKYGANVIFLGNRTDVYRLYQAMDIFVLPSKIEGFPVVGIEAQANGLTVLFSDKVPREAEITANRVKYIPLSLGAGHWASIVMKSNVDRKETNLFLYDISSQASRLIQYYEKCLK